ncbi:MAG: LysR family transcriptional regulator [Clostridium sp.]|nr:LysR family transcriptional regulator [Clostridium sp.]
MDITYDYYRIFYYVAKYKSFTRAATVLMNNQPNISRAMNNLEKQLGCTLFLRSNRGISLTPEGKKLYNHVSVAYRHLQAAELELSGSNTLESGNVTISASETALHGILLDVLRDFHNAYPNIHIHILSHTTPEAIQTVRSGLADFCVVTSPTRVRHPFKETVLMEFHEILVGSRKYSELSEKKMRLQDLQQYPMVCLGRNSMTYSYFSEQFLKRKFVLDPEVEVATSEQLIPIITHDLGIGFIPDFLSKEPLRKGVIIEIPLKDKLPPRQICLVEDSGHALSVAATKLKHMLVAAHSTTETE